VIHSTRHGSTIQELEVQLQTSSTEDTVLRERLESARRESLTDPLTGIRTEAFDTELAESIERAVESGEPLSLLMCDIDHFKIFNDTGGIKPATRSCAWFANCISEKNVKDGHGGALRRRGSWLSCRRPSCDAMRASRADSHEGRIKKLVKKSTGDILGAITISIGRRAI